MINGILNVILTLKFSPVFKEYLSIPIRLKSNSFETSITIAIKENSRFHYNHRFFSLFFFLNKNQPE